MAKFGMNPFLERWVSRKAVTNAWRMPVWMSPEDLVQEAHANWQLVNNHYDPVVRDVAHMVALFKTTFQNNLTDFARNPHNPRGETSLDAIVEATGTLPEVDADGDPEVAGFIAEAPEPVKSILDLLTNHTERILVRPSRVYLDGTRDTLNRRIHRALLQRGAHIDPRTDALKLVHDYLKPKRVRIYDEPTLIELVGVMVDNYLHPEPAQCSPQPPRAVLRLSPTLVKAAKDRVNSFLQPKPAKLRRVRLRPIVVRKRIA